MAGDIQKILEENSKEVNKTIDYLVSEFIFPQLRDPALYLIKAGGKRIRPTILILTAKAFGCDSKFVLPPAASIELMHTASLIHDDIIDNCTIRRGVESVHIKWDIPTAVLAGDALLSVAVRALAQPLAKANMGGVALSYISEDFIENLNLFSKFWGEICEGKKMDILYQIENLTESQVFELIYKKTASLFELAGKLGANYAGAKPEASEKLGEFGKNLGMAFQIRDDILGLVGNEKVLGKNVGVDLTNGKKTLLLSYFMSNSTPKEKKAVLKVLGNRDADQADVREATDLIVASGAVEYAKSHGKAFIKLAKEKLDVLDNSEPKRDLNALSDYVLKRLK